MDHMEKKQMIASKIVAAVKDDLDFKLNLNYYDYNTRSWNNLHLMNRLYSKMVDM